MNRRNPGFGILRAGGGGCLAICEIARGEKKNVALHCVALLCIAVHCFTYTRTHTHIYIYIYIYIYIICMYTATQSPVFNFITVGSSSLCKSGAPAGLSSSFQASHRLPGTKFGRCWISDFGSKDSGGGFQQGGSGLQGVGFPGLRCAESDLICRRLEDLTFCWDHHSDFAMTNNTNARHRAPNSPSPEITWQLT